MKLNVYYSWYEDGERLNDWPVALAQLLYCRLAFSAIMQPTDNKDKDVHSAIVRETESLLEEIDRRKFKIASKGIQLAHDF